MLCHNLALTILFLILAFYLQMTSTFIVCPLTHEGYDAQMTCKKDLVKEECIELDLAV